MGGQLRRMPQVEVAEPACVPQPIANQELYSAIDVLGQAMCGLLTERCDVLEQLERDTTPAPVANPLRDLALQAASLSLGAATAAAGGVVGALAATLVSDGLMREAVKSATKDVVDEALTRNLAAGFDTEWAKDVEPRVAFFRAPRGGFIDAQTAVVASLREPRCPDDPLGSADEVRALAREVVSARPQIGAIQRQASLAGWMNFLARSDLGVIERGEDDNGADLDGMRAVDRSLLADPARGVLRTYIRGDRGLQGRVVSAAVAGLNPVVLRTFADKTPYEAGISVFAEAALDGHPRGGAEIGENEMGALSYSADRGGEAWLSRYPTQDGDWGPDAETDTPEDGARYLLKDLVWTQTFAELGVRHA